MFRFGLVMAMFLAFFCTNAVSAEYEISRNSDGNFRFSISGIFYNVGSTLKRESILLNDSSCPVLLTSNKLKFDYTDRSFRVKATTLIDVKVNVKAVEVRTIIYDVFGKHMKNLVNTEPKDFSPGASSLNSIWNVTKNDTAELLTSVTYVARVLFDDGTQWVFNADNLHLALASLNLEEKIGEE